MESNFHLIFNNVFLKKLTILYDFNWKWIVISIFNDIYRLIEKILFRFNTNKVSKLTYKVNCTTCICRSLPCNSEKGNDFQ